MKNFKELSLESILINYNLLKDEVIRLEIDIAVLDEYNENIGLSYFDMDLLYQLKEYLNLKNSLLNKYSKILKND